jgi:hypothetical protein
MFLLKEVSVITDFHDKIALADAIGLKKCGILFIVCENT